MTKKQIWRTVAFALVVCLLFLALCDVFELTDNSYVPARFQTYYKLNEDTLDAVWIGTSGVDRYWIGAKAYEEYGMTVYPLSSDHMGAWLFTELADEALRSQSPELLIVDLRAFSQSNDDVELTDTRSRRLLDAMDPFSVNRLRVISKTKDTLQHIDSETSSYDISYLFSFIKYHSLWAEDDFSLSDSISHKECPYLGFFMKKFASVRGKDPIPHVYQADYYSELDPISEEALYDFLEYVEQKKLNVLFVNTPGVMTKRERGRANTVCKILAEHDIDYINYCLTDEEGTFTLIPELDYSLHFYNRNHVNYYGAELFTKNFSAYLNENYGFKDHRNEEAVKEDWDGVYDKIKDKIEYWENLK